MEDIDAIIGAIGYALATLGFLLLTGLLLTSFRQRLRSLFLAGAATITALWAASLAGGAVFFPLTTFQVFLVEFSIDAAWILFLATLMGLGVGGSQFVLLRRIGIGAVAGFLVLGALLEFGYASGRTSTGAAQLLILGQIVTALLVLIYVEQIIRNARQQQGRGLKYLCLGIAVIFAYDLVMYSYAIVAEQISPALWAARGYVAAMTLPLIVVAVNRTPTWSGGIFVSRQVVFHTATVFAAGIYLTFIGLAGQYIREYGGSWGVIAQIVFIVAAIIALSVLLFSERFRLHSRVFISKHFYRNKYDYRQEWLRLIETMTAQEESMPLQKRAIKAFAEILSSSTGQLWLQSGDTKVFQLASSWNVAGSEVELAADSALPKFLSSSGWIVDLREYEGDATLYEDLIFDSSSLGLDNARFIIPLISDVDLVGFIVLSAPTADTTLNYEDRDLLKTAGKQVASYISQELATELLAQNRQFEAFNKLTAYLMHDLKNVIAQHSLLVENAHKHKHNPEFIDDAISTISSGVTRMRGVIEQLKQSSVQHSLENVELGKLIVSAVSQCTDRQPVPRSNIGDERVWVRADRDRLHMAICHAIRNAQDATDDNGNIEIELTHNDSRCYVDVRDNGIGMDDEFVRDRLFRPFDSTKGTQGMGIGAYQIRETLRNVGGALDVESSVGTGTLLRMTFEKV